MINALLINFSTLVMLPHLLMYELRGTLRAAALSINIAAAVGALANRVINKNLHQHPG